MKDLLVDFLICPSCLPVEEKLRCTISEKDGEDILTGSLHCSQCNNNYPIQEGVAILLPVLSEVDSRIPSKYESSMLISSYLWAHYADIFKDMDATAAYEEWSALLRGDSGISLDAGCSVGRFTFEMSKKSDFAVGIDNSHAFIKTARQLMINRQMEFSIPEEGLLTEQRIIKLPETFDSTKVEFVVGDAQRLPFRRNSFSSVSSLNLVDKVPLPLLHLKEVNRVARKSHAQFLFSDPFSWSSDISREENWLGGTADGPYPGMGIDNIFSLLSGQTGEMVPPWEMEKQGQIWWKIRNHKNHFELIRSRFIKAGR
jgi:SAM-dependent methyltransferase/uncharacterized protein YbaR (Trm112 family)